MTKLWTLDVNCSRSTLSSSFLSDFVSCTFPFTYPTCLEWLSLPRSNLIQLRTYSPYLTPKYRAAALFPLSEKMHFHVDSRVLFGKNSQSEHLIILCRSVVKITPSERLKLVLGLSVITLLQRRRLCWAKKLQNIH